MTAFAAPRRSRAAAFALTPLAAAAALLAAGCSSSDGNSTPVNTKPSYVTIVSSTSYDGSGSNQDLLTAGLGASGLASATAPTYVDASAPTALELRRAAIYNSYRAIVDTTTAGGYTILYGPNVDAAGTVTTSEGKISGTEVLAYSDDSRDGSQNVTLMVQLPANFSTALPCIVTATSSGSRGIYGGIAVGEWGLKRGCAVAYTDKGTGAAPHDLQADTVPLIDGRRSTAAAARAAAAASGAGGTLAQFDAGLTVNPLTAAEQAAFNAATPNRLAFKHAHSRLNVEKDWGRYTLQAIEFAFYVINESYGAALVGGGHGRSYTPANTLVIAAGVSNGGGAAIAAAEQDTGGLIDGVAVGEPQIQMPSIPAVTVQRNGVVAVSGKSLYDYTSFANLHEPCASQASSLAAAPGRALLGAPLAAARCSSLEAKGQLAGVTATELAEKARLKLRSYGWEAESEPLFASLAALEVASSIAVTYANSYSRASVKDNLCGYSFAAVNAAFAPTAIAPAALATLFASGNDVPPLSGVAQIVNNRNPGGPVRDLVSASPSTGTQDLNLDGALCLRNLASGTDAASLALQTGVAETRRSGNLRGKPTVIVHGRSDALIPVNHSSRPYLALNKTVEPASSRLSYVEVTNAQHFDAFIGNAALAGYDTRYVPLHVYVNRALDAVYLNLRTGAALPPSQVVRTVPRGGTAGAAPAITAANVPGFAAAPGTADAITVSGTTVNVPD